MNSKIAIIGGGASGLFCAIVLKQYLKNIDVCIYEGQNKVGKKILQTGNGKCNLSNTNLSIDNYNSNKIQNVLNNFGYNDLIKILNFWGLQVRIDEEGRIYPYSEKATTVLDVFLNKLNQYNVNVKCNCYVNEIIKNDKYILITNNNQKYEADYVIVCTGGCSSITYNYNSNKLLSKLGHNYSELMPSLCALKTKENTKSLSGLRVKCNAKMIVDGNLVKETKGEVLFKDDGLSGIAIFILSQYYNKNKKCIISLDLFEDKSVEELNNILLNNESLENNLLGYFPKMINYDIINRSENKSIGEVIKNYNFNIINTYGFNNAQVTKGGILLDEIDNNSFESKKCENLYIAGEALDIDGSCGGYNLHFAFASGYMIASNLIEKLGDKNE